MKRQKLFLKTKKGYSREGIKTIFGQKVISISPEEKKVFFDTKSLAYDKLVASVKAARAELARLGLQAAGDVFIVYTSSDDLGFDYEVQLPFSGTTTSKPQGGAKLGGSHAGKVLKFRHSGAFSDMDGTYEQIANYLDEKNINSEELYIEQYRSDIVTTPADKLEIDILVPLP